MKSYSCNCKKLLRSAKITKAATATRDADLPLLTLLRIDEKKSPDLPGSK